MCCAERGHRVHARPPSSQRAGRQQRRHAGRPASRLRASGRAPRAADAAQTSCMSLTCGVGDLRVFEALRPPASAVSDAKASTISARSAARCGDALGVAGEARVARERGLQQHLVAERCPLALVLQAQHHGLAVAGRERAVGVDRGVAGAGARRRRRAVEGVVQRVAHPLGQRLEHRDVDALAAAGLSALQQRRQDVACTRTCRRRCRRSTGRPCTARRACR